MFIDVRKLSCVVAIGALLSAAACGDDDTSSSATTGGGSSDATAGSESPATQASSGEVAEYGFAMLSDFTGPQAVIFTDAQPARDAVLEWWNDNVGAEIGVRLRGESYDTRFDAAQVASLWPSVLSELDPVVVLGAGGPTVQALAERLPSDGVPMAGSGGGYGYGWVPYDYISFTKPPLTFEAAACISWMGEQLNRPVRVAELGTSASSTFVDLSEGLDHFDDGSDDVEIVARELVDIAPADVTDAMSRIVDAEPDLIVVFVSTPMAVAAVRALESLGSDIPIAVSQHASLGATASALGDASLLEGSIECSANVPPVEEGPAFEYFTMLSEDYGLDAAWNGNTITGISQTLIALRAVEAAVAEVGADALTGDAVREAIAVANFSDDDLFGSVPGGWAIDGTDAPYPTDVVIDISTIDADGTVQLAAEDVPVPELTPWG